MCKKLQIKLMLCLLLNFVIIKIDGMPTIQNYDIWSDNNNENKLNGNDVMNGTNSRDPKG